MAQEFEEIVDLHYPGLYRFAMSLTHRETEACDLTQQTFYIWAQKGAQLRDASKIKSWLFTTLHREFLGRQRNLTRFPQVEINAAEGELPEMISNADRTFDAQLALGALQQIEPAFRAAVGLFYLEDYTHPQIAEILEIPLGTVKSRISRGIAQLQKILRCPKPSVAERSVS